MSPGSLRIFEAIKAGKAAPGRTEGGGGDGDGDGDGGGDGGGGMISATPSLEVRVLNSPRTQAAAVAVKKANGPMTEETRSALRRFVRALAVTQRSRCVGGGEASL